MDCLSPRAQDRGPHRLQKLQVSNLLQQHGPILVEGSETQGFQVQDGSSSSCAIHNHEVPVAYETEHEQLEDLAQLQAFEEQQKIPEAKVGSAGSGRCHTKIYNIYDEPMDPKHQDMEFEGVFFRVPKVARGGNDAKSGFSLKNVTGGILPFCAAAWDLAVELAPLPELAAYAKRLGGKVKEWRAVNLEEEPAEAEPEPEADAEAAAPRGRELVLRPAGDLMVLPGRRRRGVHVLPRGGSSGTITTIVVPADWLRAARARATGTVEAVPAEVAVVLLARLPKVPLLAGTSPVIMGINMDHDTGIVEAAEQPAAALGGDVEEEDDDEVVVSRSGGGGNTPLLCDDGGGGGRAALTLALPSRSVVAAARATGGRVVAGSGGNTAVAAAAARASSSSGRVSSLIQRFNGLTCSGGGAGGGANNNNNKVVPTQGLQRHAEAPGRVDNHVVLPAVPPHRPFDNGAVAVGGGRSNTERLPFAGSSTREAVEVEQQQGGAHGVAPRLDVGNNNNTNNEEEDEVVEVEQEPEGVPGDEVVPAAVPHMDNVLGWVVDCNLQLQRESVVLRRDIVVLRRDIAVLRREKESLQAELDASLAREGQGQDEMLIMTQALQAARAALVVAERDRDVAWALADVARDHADALLEGQEADAAAAAAAAQTPNAEALFDRAWQFRWF